MSTTKKEEKPYNKEFTDLLEMMWGEGQLSPGGIASLEELIKEVDPEEKTIIDYGSGLGGHAIYLAKNYSSKIIGCDVDEDLVAHALESAKKVGKLKGELSFLVQQENGPLSIDSKSADVVYAKESILHVKEKRMLFESVFNALKADGFFIIYDWFHRSPDYGSAMDELVNVDGLMFNLATIDEYREILEGVGFASVVIEETSSKTIRDNQADIDCILGQKGEQIKKRFGDDFYQHVLRSWTVQQECFEAGEMKTAKIVAKK